MQVADVRPNSYDDAAFHKVLGEMGKPLGLDRFAAEFVDGSNKLIECEIAMRAKQRADILKNADRAAGYGRIEQSSNEEGIAHLKRARELLKEASNKLDAERRRKYDAIMRNPADARKIREEVMKRAGKALSETDVEPAFVSEISQIYDETFEVMEKKGFTGVLEHADKQLEELVKVRSDKSKNWGRGHHSPLAWWKWFALAGLIAIIAAWLVANYYTGASAWWEVINAAASVVGAILPFDPIIESINYAIYLVQTGC